MKKTFKTIGLSIASVALIFGFTAAALNAWDVEGTNRLLKDYEDRKMYAPDTITPEYIEQLNKQLPFEKRVEGCCDLANHAEEFERENATMELAMQLYGSAEELKAAGTDIEVLDFDVYYNIAKSFN